MKRVINIKNKLSIPVIAIGKGWIAADKPCDLSIHNDPGDDLCSVLKSHTQADPLFADEAGYDPGFGFHAVHRLDKQTSGVILMACQPDIFRYYSEQFESQRVQKCYIALLHGSVSVPEGEWGVWSWPLSKDAGGRDHPVGKGAALESQTRFRVLRHSRHYTLTECRPLTGRKHQIRRHAKLAGHPVVGDRRYSTRRSLKYLKTRCGFHRMGLHALSVTLQPPGKMKSETIQSRGIPREIERLSEEDQSSGS